MVKKIKLLSFGAILSLLLLAILNGSFSVAISMQGNVATFELDNDDPIAFGAMIPDTNMYTAVSIDGSNQGEFVQMDWLGNPLGTEIINMSGGDISFVYPWFFDELTSKIYTPTNNNYTDPWDVRWLNISAFDAENETLSPFNISTVWNSYTMSEGGSLDIFLNSSIPMQIDINIGSSGPKIIKYDWLTDNVAGPTIDSRNLISPSGKLVNAQYRTASHGATVGSIFNYILFVADEPGFYRLLIDAHYDTPAIFRLEFLNLNIETLSTNVIRYGGVSDDIPTYQDLFDMEWTSQWYSFSGEMGDKFRLDIGRDYLAGGVNIDIWYPTASGYRRKMGLWGENWIYTAETGDIYVSFSEQNYDDLFRYSLFLTEMPVLQWNMTDPLKIIKVSKDEVKGVEFTIDDDLFVRINATSYGDGVPTWASLSYFGGFILKNASKITGFDEITPIESKTADNMDFYYYYLPKGNYEFFVANIFPQYDGVLQLSIEFVEFNSATIPINNLVYPNRFATSFSAVEFTPDEYYTSLKNAQWFEINITEPGQYKLNVTMNAVSNPGAASYGYPSYLYTYNATDLTYYDSAYPIPAFSTDPSATTSDYFYIGFSCPYTGILINFTTPGNVGSDIDIQIYDGSWSNTDLPVINDGTQDLSQNGTIEFDTTTLYFNSWEKGAGGIDFPDIENEDDYYWLRFDSDPPTFTTIPIIELITLLNITLTGDVNIRLLKDSGYQYCDFWETTPSAADDLNIDGLRVNLDEDLDDNSLSFAYDSRANWMMNSDEPYTIGFEEGVYKLLVIPEQWCYTGPVTINLAIENFWGWDVKTEYNITTNPIVHPWQITQGLVNASFVYNYTTYPYEQIITRNNTLVDWGTSKLIVNCYGSALDWTQLIVCINNVSSYDLYLMQDLTWIDNFGPNDEIKAIDTGVSDNSTFEFGVLTDDFTLIFVFDELDETITFKLGLSQYNTTKLYIEAPVVEAGVPIDPVMLVVIIIIISSIAGAAVVIVIILKKKGRI